MSHEWSGQNLKKWLPSTYLDQGLESRALHQRAIEQLLEQGKVPEVGWDEDQVNCFLMQLSLMDSNNFKKNVGLGEREARIYAPMVRRRHFGFGHGMGRSGDIAAVQPKAAGSSVMVQIANTMVKDMIHIAGIQNVKSALVVPVATGMAVTLTLLALRQQNAKGQYVIWPRIDQKSCFKSILTANLTPLILPNLLDGDGLKTDLEGLENLINTYGKESILCVLSTTSCFAPRLPDKVEDIARICARHGIGHIVNNAYGLQSSKAVHLVNQAMRVGRVDACVQSTDKNFMVPVGGAVICGANPTFIADVAKLYPGRASSSPILDLLITMLQMGRLGYQALLKERRELSAYCLESMQSVLTKYNERVLETSSNQISYAISLTTLASVASRPQDVSFFGSMLFTRGVSGTRVVTGREKKTIASYVFQGFGAHHDAYPTAYFTIACAIGITKKEVDVFVQRLDKVFQDYYEYQAKHATSCSTAEEKNRTDQ